MANVVLGSISTGTLRTEDLLESFSDELQGLDPDSYAEWQALGLQDLTDRLEQQAPYGVYFGSLTGDGADFGWWVDWEFLQMQINEEGIRLTEPSPLMQDTSWLLSDCSCEERRACNHGYVLEVNDHGNTTLRDRQGVEIWSVV